MELDGVPNSFPQEQEEWASTMEPGSPILVAAVEPEAPALTAGALAAVAAAVVLTIVAVFLLGVLLDRRQQNRIEKKMVAVRKLRNHKRVAKHLETDCTSIANNMEETAESAAPADFLRNVP